jgi:hypothetical protein
MDMIFSKWDLLLDFSSSSTLELSVNSFRSTFLGMFHLPTSGPSSMVFEHF